MVRTRSARAPEPCAVDAGRVGRACSRSCPSCRTSRSTSKHLERRLVGRHARCVRREEPVPAAHRRAAARRGRGPRVAGVRRLGKRIVIGLERRPLPGPAPDDRRPAALEGRRAGAAAASTASRRSSSRTARSSLTEAGTKQRASLHVVRGARALAALDPRRARRAGGEPRRVPRGARAREPHAQARAHRPAPVQRHRQRLLGRDPPPRAAVAAPAHAAARRGRDRAPVRARRARRSPSGPSGCAPRPASAFPRRSPRSARAWPCTAATASPAPTAARRCSASSTPTTRPTTARAARPAGGCSPTAALSRLLKDDWPRTLEELEEGRTSG